MTFADSPDNPYTHTVQKFRREDVPFQIESPFPPAGDQPQAIEQLVDNLNAGIRFQTLLGVTGSGKTFTIANVINEVQRPALIIAPNKTLAAQLYGEFREFFPHNRVNILSATTITSSRKLIFRRRTRTSRKIRRLTTRSTSFATRRRVRFSRETT